MHDQRISILFVSATLDTGGAQRFLSTLLTHLNRDLFRPQLALLRNEIGYPLPNDVSLHQLEYKGLFSFPRTVSKLKALIAQEKPDIICSNVAATNLVTGSAVTSHPNDFRWIARVGNSPHSAESWLRNFLADRLYPKADQIVANSIGLGNELKERYTNLVDRIQVLQNPTDFSYLDEQASLPRSIPPNAQEVVLLAVGRLFPQKRYDLMLQAFKTVISRHPLTLLICGDGPQRPQIEDLIRELDLQSHVRILGFCRNPHALMTQASLFLMTSDHEGSPNALIEAQGLGVPAVSTNCPHGPGEIIRDGLTGYLAEVGNPESIANSIQKFLEAPDKLLSRVQIRELIRDQFDADQLVRKWEQLFLSQVSNERMMEGLRP